MPAARSPTPLLEAGYRLVSRLRCTATAYEHAPRQPHRRGRPKLYGRKIKLMTLFQDPARFVAAPSPLYGEHLLDWGWWTQEEPLEAKQATVVWQGRAPVWNKPAQDDVRLFNASWTNPQPDVEIAQLESRIGETALNPFGCRHHSGIKLRERHTSARFWSAPAAAAVSLALLPPKVFSLFLKDSCVGYESVPVQTGTQPLVIGKAPEIFCVRGLQVSAQPVQS